MEKLHEAERGGCSVIGLHVKDDRARRGGCGDEACEVGDGVDAEGMELRRLCSPVVGEGGGAAAG